MAGSRVLNGRLRSTEFVTEEQFMQFDRILKDNYVHVGGAVAYSLPRIDVFVAYLAYVGGTDRIPDVSSRSA